MCIGFALTFLIMCIDFLLHLYLKEYKCNKILYLYHLKRHKYNFFITFICFQIDTKKKKKNTKNNSNVPHHKVYACALTFHVDLFLSHKNFFKSTHDHSPSGLTTVYRHLYIIDPYLIQRTDRRNCFTDYEMAKAKLSSL